MGIDAYLILGTETETDVATLNACFKKAFDQLIYGTSSTSSFCAEWTYLCRDVEDGSDYMDPPWAAFDSDEALAVDETILGKTLYQYKIDLASRQYDIGYEKGDMPSLRAAIQWLWTQFPGSFVGYGGVGIGEPPYIMTEARLKKLWSHFKNNGSTFRCPAKYGHTTSTVAGDEVSTALLKIPAISKEQNHG